jgi:quercetin dioxygenase-like cupin family protein
MRRLTRPGEGEPITQLERREVVILAERPEVTITWSRYASGEPGPDLHVHREHTDAFYVLDGELTFAVGPQAEHVKVAPGGFVAVPPDVVHTFINDSGAEVRWINVHAPERGFADYLRSARDGTPLPWDAFDPPADGGQPADRVIVSAPGEGERPVAGVLLKIALPELRVAEWSSGGPDDDSCYVLEGELSGPARLVSVHAPGGVRSSSP